jgi:hypothetical protein
VGWWCFQQQWQTLCNFLGELLVRKCGAVCSVGECRASVGSASDCRVQLLTAAAVKCLLRTHNGVAQLVVLHVLWPKDWLRRLQLPSQTGVGRC